MIIALSSTSSMGEDWGVDVDLMGRDIMAGKPIVRNDMAGKPQCGKLWRESSSGGKALLAGESRSQQLTLHLRTTIVHRTLILTMMAVIDTRDTIADAAFIHSYAS
jgi:hypothetical protein